MQLTGREEGCPPSPSSIACRMSFWERMSGCFAAVPCPVYRQTEAAPSGRNKTDVPRAELPLYPVSLLKGKWQIGHRSVVTEAFRIQTELLQEWPDMRLPETASHHTRGQRPIDNVSNDWNDVIPTLFQQPCRHRVQFT